MHLCSTSLDNTVFQSGSAGLHANNGCKFLFVVSLQLLVFSDFFVAANLVARKCYFFSFNMHFNVQLIKWNIFSCLRAITVSSMKCLLVSSAHLSPKLFLLQIGIQVFFTSYIYTCSGYLCLTPVWAYCFTLRHVW